MSGLQSGQPQSVLSDSAPSDGLQQLDPTVSATACKGDASSGGGGMAANSVVAASGSTDAEAGAVLPDDNHIQNRDNNNESSSGVQDGLNANNLNKTSQINASHFQAGSGVLNDSPPQRPSRRAYPQKMAARPEPSQSWKEREEKVRRIKEQQEEERRLKAEEWRLHALAAQKHREQMEMERKRMLHEARVRDQEKRTQIEERRRAMESAERERRETLFKKNLEREERLENRRKSHSNTLSYAFGSSTPRMIEPRGDSMDVGGARRSTSSTNVHGNLMTQSMYVRRSTEREATPNRHSSAGKKSSSVYGLDKSGNEGLPGDSMSSRLAVGDSVKTVVQRRTGLGAKKPRPASIAVSGMSQSMYEKKSSPLTTGASTPTNPRSTASRFSSIDNRKKINDRDDDAKSTTSSTSSSKVAGRKTPAQVKAKSAAKRNAPKTPTATNVPKFPQMEETEEKMPREVTPDIISDSDKPPGTETVKDLDVCENTEKSSTTNDENGEKVTNDAPTDKSKEEKNNEDEPCTPSGKKIITSKEEAKARIAEKRREMKEKMEREAELERQRLAELERLEEERLRKEEEEERRAMEEAEQLAAEARRAEEERLQKAIAEAQRREEEERQRKAEEERIRLEQEQEAKREAERREAELEEKRRKDEEERLARKKRLEEIMARTRGGNKNTPTKKAEEATPTTDTQSEEPEESANNTSSSNGQEEKATNEDNSSLVNGMTKLETANNIINASEEVAQSDLIKPDLLNDTNEKNQMKNLDDFDPFGSKATKDGDDTTGDDITASQEQPVFDQILDLGSETMTKTSATQPSAVMLGAPIIAFEDANNDGGHVTSTQTQEVPTGDLLS